MPKNIRDFVTSFRKIENAGTENTDTSADNRAINILEDSIGHIGNRYGAGLSWKQENQLPRCQSPTWKPSATSKETLN